MPEQPRSGGLDAEALAAYLEGQLPPEARAKVEAEIAADPEAYEWLVHALHVSDAETTTGEAAQASGGIPADAAEHLAPSKATDSGADRVAGPVVLPFVRRRAVQASLVAALAAAAALVLVVRQPPEWWRQIARPAVDPRVEKLVAAVGEERYIEGRLTGGFEYRPLRSATRGPGDLSNQNLALLAAAGELQRVAQEDPSAENLHAWGVAQGLLGEHDGAIASLRSSIERRRSPQVIADLAAIYVARYAASGNRDDLTLALEQADAALGLDASLAAAQFTRAVTLRHLGHTSEATSAWQRYLTLDGDSGWAAEARLRLKESASR